MKNFKRHLSMLLAFIMLVTIIPFKSFAADDVKIYNVKVTNGEFDLRGSYIKDGSKKITFNQFRIEYSQDPWNQGSGSYYNNNGLSYIYYDGNGNTYRIIVPSKNVYYGGNYVVVLKNGRAVDQLHISEVNTRFDNIGSEEYLKENTKFEVEEGILYLYLPMLANGQKGTYKIDDKEAQEFYRDKIEVDRIYNYGYDYRYGQRPELKNHTAEITVTEKDKKISYTVKYNPSYDSLRINYAYIVGNNLVLNITSDFGINERGIQYRPRGDRDYKYVDDNHGLGYSSSNRYLLGSYNENYYDPNKIYDKNDYVIKNVLKPSIQEIMVTDNGGARRYAEIQINSEDDTKVLYGTAPKQVSDFLNKIKNGIDVPRVKTKDLIILKKGEYLDTFREFGNEIKDTFRNFSQYELTFSSPQINNFSSNYQKFDSVGRYEIEISRTNSSDKFKFTVLVIDGKNNVLNYELVKNPKAKKETFKPMEAFKFNTSDKKDPNPIGYYAIYDGKYYRMNDDIKFKAGETKAKFTVRDIINNRDIQVEIEQTMLQTMTKAEARNKFTDIFGHWAEDKIVTMVAMGVINGYPNNTFRPENKISDREALSMLGLFAQTLDENKVNKVVNENPYFSSSTWGNENVKYVLQRIPANIFSGKDLEDNITREEVAYVMAHLFKYNNTGSDKGLSDVSSSAYAQEVRQLISAGTISGYPEGKFKPKNNIKRSEFATMLFFIPGINFDFVK